GAGSGGRGGAAAGGATGGVAGGVAGVGGTAGVTTTYSPCPAPPALCKILPFGDSITMGVGSNGSNSNGGYRVELFHRAHADGKSITFVGTATANGPTMVDGVTFPRQHEGHSGYTIDNAPGKSGISPLVTRVMPATKPDIVTLMIGTNDVQHDIDVTNAPARLGKLLDSIIATDAHMLLVVAQIVPTTDAKVNVAVQAFNNAIPALVNSRSAAGKHIILVDMYQPIASAPGFQASGSTVPDNKVGPMYDWLHPNVAGYKVMGDTWYDAIKGALR
ncbi:MAG: SGNH/GDSL hydrolase family protein, partial [Myxococcales bacterium]